MKKLLIALALSLLPSLAMAQCNGVFPANTICGKLGTSGPPGPVAQSALTGIPGGAAGQIQYNNAGNFGGFTMGGDCTVTTSTGIEICTKTNGTAFGPFATTTDAHNSIANFNSGTGASSSTFWRGDGTWASPSATSSQCLVYVPVGGDNTANITAALNSAIAGGLTLCLPAGTIQISGNWIWPSFTRIVGAGRDVTILQKTTNTAGTFISAIGSSGTHVHDIYASDFTVDANSASTSQAQYFTIATDFVDNFTMERTKWIHAYNGGHVFGSVTGGTPTVPNGWQTQTNFTFRNNLFDCSGGKVNPNSGDCVDMLWIDGLVVENNVFQHSGVNGLSTEFNRNFLYIGNRFIDTAWGLYAETSQDGAVIGNVIYNGGSATNPAHSTSPIIGIWFPDANQTYVAGGYGGSQRVKFIGNSVHNEATTTFASGIQGLVINAPAGSLAAQDLYIEGNSFDAFQVTTGPNNGVVLNGAMDTITVKGNICRAFSGTSLACIVASGSYTAPGMAAAQSSINMTFVDNVSDTVTPLQSPAPTCSVTSAGTGATCAVAVDSTDSNGTITITAGTTAAASGNLTLNIATSLGRSASQCLSTLLQGTGWQGTATTLLQNTAQTAPIFLWNNGGVALSNGGTYSITYQCKGR